MSSPVKSAAEASSTGTSRSPQRRVRPGDRPEAKKRISATGNCRSMRIDLITPPTCPVAPNTPTLTGLSPAAPIPGL